MISLQTLLLFFVPVLFFLCSSQSSENRYIPDPNDPICRKSLDLLLIVEEGCGYMDDPKCIRLKQHLIDLAFHFQVGNTIQYSRIGVISYDQTPHIRLPLSKGTSTGAILHSIESIRCDDQHSPSANNLVAAIDAGLHEFSRSPRRLANHIQGIRQAMIIYPSCDCTRNGTLCNSNDPNTVSILQKLASKQVVVYTSGPLTSSQDYTCLVSDYYSKDNYLFDNPTCDMLPYIYDAQTLARLFCPV